MYSFNCMWIRDFGFTVACHVNAHWHRLSYTHMRWPVLVSRYISRCVTSTLNPCTYAGVLLRHAMPSYSFSPHPHAVFENLLKSPSSNLPIAMDGISSFSAPPTAPAGRKCARTPCQLSARSWRIRTMSFSQPTRNAAVPIVLRRL